MMTSWARGGRRRCRPGDGEVHGVTGLGTTPGAQRHGLGEDDIVAGSETVPWDWGRRLCGRQRHMLGSGKMTVHKEARSWSGMMTRRLWGVLNESTEAPVRTR
jgi:hypothetical protein